MPLLLPRLHKYYTRLYNNTLLIINYRPQLLAIKQSGIIKSVTGGIAFTAE